MSGRPDSGDDTTGGDRADRPGGPGSPELDPAAVAEMDALVERIVAARAAMDTANRERDRARADLAAMRRRPFVRVADGVARRGRGATSRLRGQGRWLVAALASVPVLERLVPVAPGTHRLRSSAARERALVEAARAVGDPVMPSGYGMVQPSAAAGELGRPGAGAGPPAVSAVVRGRDRDRVERTLRWLEDTAVGRVVVQGPADLDPAVGAGPRFRGGPVERVFGRAEAVARAASGADLLLALHDDVRPVAASAVGRLIATMAARSDLAAVAPELILPRRRGPARGPLVAAADLTVGSAGVGFGPDTGLVSPLALDRGDQPTVRHALDVVPAATDACLLVRVAALDRPGGDGFESGLADDGDLGLALAVRASGGTIAVDRSAPMFHPETDEEPPRVSAELAHRLRRSVLRDRLEGSGSWSGAPFHLGITVTRDDEQAGFGDWYTAHELGDAVARLGWRVTYLERHADRWYDLPADLDGLLVLIDLYDLARVPPGIIRIAWVRNWPDHWVEREWFDDYDLVLASSAAAKGYIEARTAARPVVFPIATNPERFAARAAGDVPETDVVFVGSHFGRPREIDVALPAIAAAGQRAAVWGHGWDVVPAVASIARGPAPYEDVAAIYRSAAIVIDDTLEGSTRDLGMLNSRVFDALATGTLVVSTNAVGVRELFDEDFPTWAGAEDLAATVASLTSAPERGRTLAARYRAMVVERHTYERRADELRSLLLEWTAAERWAIAIGPRNREAARTWGDTYFARAVQRQLARLGRPTSVWVHDEWRASGGLADVVLHLFGARAPEVAAGPLTILWVISHPERVTAELCADYDRVVVASDRFAADLGSRTAVPVAPLHQATDPERFRPTTGGPEHELLFVGSSRGQRRPIVDAAIASGHDVSVFGGGWTPELLEPRFLRGEWVPNDELAAWYSAASIVLADHYDDMRELGFISNRLYDALACGALVICDDVPGLAAEFDDGAVPCRTPGEVAAALGRYLADPTARRARAERGRAAVVGRHTFKHRAEELTSMIDPILRGRSRDLGSGR